MAFNQEPKMIVKYGFFFNSNPVIYSDYGVDVDIPPYEASDGPTLTIIPRWFLSNRDYVLGVEAALVHDYMCRHKTRYDRRIASKMLYDIWVFNGLNKFKGIIVYLCVDLYQWIRFGKEWAS